MIDNTEARPEALRLADLYTAETWPGGLSLNQWALSAATELRRQHAEIERLRALAATCYAGLGGECDLPVIWLDALNDAANGEAFDTDDLLPYASAIRAQLVAQTNRAAAAEQQVAALTLRLDMANRLNTDARNLLAQQAASERLAKAFPQAAEMFHPLYVQGFKAGYRRGGARGKRSVLRQVGKLVDEVMAAPPPPEREPLTDEQIAGLFIEMYGQEPVDITEFAEVCGRVEAAHGIGATND